MAKYLQSFKSFILWCSIPLQKFMQRSGRDETIITKEIVDLLLSKIKPGDILLSYEHQRWTSWFIKGFYDHAVIVSYKNTVVEAVGDKFEYGKNVGGVREVPLEEWLYKKDQVAVVRTKLSFEQISNAAQACLRYVGCGYDYTFSHNNETVYCSELPYLCYIREWKWFLQEIPLYEEILPQDYLDLCKCLPYLYKVIDTKELTQKV